VKVIVPFAPGGGSDTLARVLVRKIQNRPGEHAPWVIINVPGAGGTIGSRRVRKAKPDGHTLLFLHDGILTAKYAGQSPFGPEAFTPVGATGSLGMVICVPEASPFQTLNDLLVAAEASPDTVTFAANIGAPSYFMARSLEQEKPGASFRYVQSGGGARRFADLSGGHVQSTAFSVSEYLNFREGGIRALAVLDESRHPALPTVPSALEQGYSVTYRNLQGWWAPAETPAPVVESLQSVLRDAFESPALRRYSEEQCLEPDFLDSRELAAAMIQKSEMLVGLDLEFERRYLPPVGLFLMIGVALGGLLTIPSPAAGRSLTPTSTIRQSLSKRLGLAALLVGFIVSLSFPLGMFLPAGILFMGAAGLIISGFENLRATILVSIAAPLSLYLFLSSLLGIDLP